MAAKPFFCVGGAFVVVFEVAAELVGRDACEELVRWSLEGWVVEDVGRPEDADAGALGLAVK